MAGERTPDTSDPASSASYGGSTDNDISLREHIQRQIDTLERHLTRVIRENRLQLDERYETQTKALDAAFAAQQELFNAALIAAERAVSKAEVATDKRFEAVNEFRAQLSTQTSTFMPRTESIQRHDATAARVTELEKRFTEALAIVNSRLDRTQGTAQGIDKAWGYIIGAVGLAGGILGLVIGLS